MDWFIISPINGLESWPDDTEGAEKVKAFIEHELKYYKDHGIKPSDFFVFRGERHEFVPPSKKPSLVKRTTL